jgi:hypothetical protein
VVPGMWVREVNRTKQYPGKPKKHLKRKRMGCAKRLKTMADMPSFVPEYRLLKGPSHKENAV